MSQLTRLLNPNETILWSGKPIRRAFVLPGLGSIPIGLFFFGGFLLFFYLSPESFISSGLFILPLVLVPTLIFLPTIWQILRFRNTEYVITDQRVMIQSGAIGRNTRLLDLNKIQEAHLQRGFLDKQFGTGSIMILTAGQYAMGNIGGDAVSWEPWLKITPGISYIKDAEKVQALLLEAKEKTPRDSIPA